MKVLLLRANPRKTGYTERLCNLFLNGLKDGGAEVNNVDLTQLSITQCDGCYHCWLATPGQCVHSDDMGALLEDLLEAELTVCATPVYYSSMASCMKAFFERLFPLSAPGVVPSRNGLTRNNLRYPERWHDKKLISIVVGAMKEPAFYVPVNETFRLIAESIDVELTGQLTRPEASWLDYRFSKPKTIKLIETAFYDAGRQAAQTGRIKKETLETTAMPLAANEELFRLYSRYYWEVAQKMGADALDISQLRTQVGLDVRILMREMVRYIDPKATSTVKTVIEFEFPDKELFYQIQIEDGHCRLHEGRSLKPDLQVRCDSLTWANLFTRQLEPRRALAERKIVLEGEKSLFARLERYFPPPAI